jgi:hypothetical protein
MFEIRMRNVTNVGPWPGWVVRTRVARANETDTMRGMNKVYLKVRRR